MIQAHDDKVTFTIDVRLGDIANEIKSEGSDGALFEDWAREHLADYGGWLRLALTADVTKRIANLYIDEMG